MTNPTSWDTDPIAAFEKFVLSEAFAKTARRLRADGLLHTVSAESAVTYTSMFRNFIVWMNEQGKTLSTITRIDLQRFINRTVDGGRILNSKIGYRYLRLLERCYEHLGAVPNPAREAILATDSTELTRDRAGRALSDEQLQRFFDALPADPPRRRRVTQFDGWKRRRDRAMQVVIALAGLRVAEAVGLLLSEVGHQVDIDGSIKLTITPEQKHHTSYEHATTLPREGVDELRPWLKEREAMARAQSMKGDFVFPANTDGAKLNKTTVYRQVRATFERAGIDLSRAGGRTLRNTFAQRQLAQGSTTEQLREILGLARERSAADYKLAKVTPDPEK